MHINRFTNQILLTMESLTHWMRSKLRFIQLRLLEMMNFGLEFLLLKDIQSESFTESNQRSKNNVMTVADVLQKTLPRVILELAVINTCTEMLMSEVPDELSPAAVLNRSFKFKDTKEGHCFWCDIRDRIAQGQTIPDSFDAIQVAMLQLGDKGWRRFRSMRDENIYSLKWATPNGQFTGGKATVLEINPVSRKILFGFKDDDAQLCIDSKSVFLLNITEQQQEMKTILEYLHTLPKIYFDIAIKEIISQKGAKGLQSRCESILQAIGSFTWAHTIQGQSFWNHVHERAYKNEKLTNEFDAIEIVQSIGIDEWLRFTEFSPDVHYMVTWSYNDQIFSDVFYALFADIKTRQVRMRKVDDDSQTFDTTAGGKVLQIIPLKPLQQNERKTETKNETSDHKSKHRRTLFVSAVNALSHISLRDETKIVVNPKIIQDLRSYIEEKRLHDECQICNQKQAIVGQGEEREKATKKV